MRDDHIFIMGAPRSGTEMLARALGRSLGTYLITEHKNKARFVPEEKNEIPELVFWRKAVGFPREPALEVDYDPDKFRMLDNMWTSRAGGCRLIIKNPSNVVRATEIRRGFPRATFVWLIRNPWSVLQSMFGGPAAGLKEPFFLRAQNILACEDSVLRAAKSWVLSIEKMEENWSPQDITTTYERLTEFPETELKRLAEHLKLTLNPDATAVPRKVQRNLTVARYLLNRCPNPDLVLSIIRPHAFRYGYPETPPGFPGDTILLAGRYLLAWLRQRKRKPPYGFPRLEAIRSRMFG